MRDGLESIASTTIHHEIQKLFGQYYKLSYRGATSKYTSDAYASMNWVRIGLDNGLSPIRRQAIIWTNAGLLCIGP